MVGCFEAAQPVSGHRLAFAVQIAGQNIPAALFDCVIDNLIDNALEKRRAEPRISVFVEIDLNRCARSFATAGLLSRKVSPQNCCTLLSFLKMGWE